jgi:hypothetical protein
MDEVNRYEKGLAAVMVSGAVSPLAKDTLIGEHSAY